jgi:hypothetical protein
MRHVDVHNNSDAADDIIMVVKNDIVMQLSVNCQLLEPALSFDVFSSPHDTGLIQSWKRDFVRASITELSIAVIYRILCIYQFYNQRNLHLLVH